MRNVIRRLSPLAFLALATSLFAISCLTDPDGVTYQPAYFALAPSFQSEASSIIDVASIHVLLVRDEDETVAIDTVITHEAFSDSVDLSFSVLVSSSSETFTLTLECLDPTGEIVFQAGPLTVIATTSSTDNVVAEDVPLDYVGIGFDAADIDVPDAEVYYIHMGDELTVEAQALDSSGAAIVGTPIKWTSLDTTMLRFPDPAVGRMVAGQSRGPVLAQAELLTGQADIFDVYVEPVPSEITVVSGGGQTGSTDNPLGNPIVVQVDAPDGPMSGVPIDFSTNDGRLNPTTATSDTEGRATTQWTLGSTEGTQTATATATNWPDVHTTITATAMGPGQQVAWTNASGGNWSEGSNWSTGSPPTATDTAVIVLPAPYTVVLDADATVATLVIGNGTDDVILNVTEGTNLTVTDSAHVQTRTIVWVYGNILGDSRIIMDGSLYWYGGTIGGSAQLDVGAQAVFSISNTGITKTLDSRQIANYGQMTWWGNDIVLANDAVFNNMPGALFYVEAGATMSGVGSLSNSGYLEKRGADSTIVQVYVGNNDSLNVSSGYLVLEGTFASGGVVTGTGTLDLTDALVSSFNGNVRPGNGSAPGILTVEGNLPLGPNSTVFIEINGTTAGTDYDHLNVFGDLGQDGTLNIAIGGGFTPAIGDSFVVFDFLTTSGSFDNVNGLDIGSGMELDTTWGANSLTLEVVNATQAPPTDIVFFSDSGGSLDVGVFAGASDGSSVAKIRDTGIPSGYLIAPRWSQPDKQRVAYGTDASGTSALWMVNSDGTEPYALVNEATVAAAYPRWNSTGEHLGFVCRVVGPAVIDHICVIPNVSGPISSIPVNTYTTVTTALPALWQAGPAAAAWNPSEALPNQIFVARDSTGNATVSKFFSINYDGSNPAVLTTDLMQGIGGPLRVLEMDVSPDGSQIVFVGEDTETFDESLWVIGTDGTGLTRITAPATGYYDERPVFSPNGTEVLFGRRNNGTCELTYMAANTDGSGERQLAFNAISCESDINGLVGMDWSPDGSQIVLVGFGDTVGHERVFVVPSDVTPNNYMEVRVPVGRDSDSGLAEGQPNWRP